MYSLFIHSTKIKKCIEVADKEVGQKLNFILNENQREN